MPFPVLLAGGVVIGTLLAGGWGLERANKFYNDLVAGGQAASATQAGNKAMAEGNQKAAMEFYRLAGLQAAGLEDKAAPELVEDITNTVFKFAPLAIIFLLLKD